MVQQDPLDNHPDFHSTCPFNHSNADSNLWPMHPKLDNIVKERVNTVQLMVLRSQYHLLQTFREGP